MNDRMAYSLLCKVSNDIDRQLEDMIQSLVAEEIARQIPQSLRDQIMDHKRHLEEVHVNLQNACAPAFLCLRVSVLVPDFSDSSEARRANALLRSTHLKDPLHPLLKANGEVSAKFPRDLTALFALDAAEAKALSSEYGLPDIGDSRERNLNRFMQFCGVSYQMVSYLPDRCPSVLRSFPSSVVSWRRSNFSSLKATKCRPLLVEKGPPFSLSCQLRALLLAW